MEGDQNEMYRECLRNHAASLGSYATDGCGEFTPDDITTSVGGGGGGLICAACGCHRNFHRKVPTRQSLQLDAAAAEEMIDYGGGRAAATAYSPHSSSERSSKKRHRTKFTEEQKEKMLGFAEKLEWRLQRPKDVEEDEIERFCRGVGISRKVFKVWMHNHKNNNNNNNNNNNSTNNSHSGNNASSLTQDQ